MSTTPSPLHRSTPRKVLLAGATGLVGREILRLLLADEAVGNVVVVGRRDPGVVHPKLTARLVDFGRLPVLAPVDDVYLALGTTIGVAGSRQAFRAVDIDANLAVAQAGVLAGARRVALVSVMNADPASRFFYTRTKGELEAALARLTLDALVIAQPSLLLGDRAALQQPLRIGETLSIWASRLLGPFLPASYAPVRAEGGARAAARDAAGGARDRGAVVRRSGASRGSGAGCRLSAAHVSGHRVVGGSADTVTPFAEADIVERRVPAQILGRNRQRTDASECVDGRLAVGDEQP